MSCSWGTCDLAGEGTATLEDGTVAYGVWRDGLLEGKGNMSRGDGGVVRGHFTKGCLGGLVTVEEESGGLLVGAYRGGVVSGGPIWLLLPSGEGAVYNEAHGGYGHLTRSGESGMILTMTLHCRALFTGDGVSFLYPDLNTGLQGRFVAATMLAAGVICDYSPEFMRLDCIL